MSGRLLRLHGVHGQSPWLDNLQRRDIESGRLASLIERGVRGLTSNPTIFQKAIQGSSDYDAQFAAVMQRGTSVEDAYWELVEADIRGAADLFGPLHEFSGGTDGFVSVEVDPRLAGDSHRTISDALALRDRIDRPNVMIKVPGTKAGLAAIRTLVAEGTNVNVTLIFGLSRYAEVIEAHIGGLEDRAARGLPVSGTAGVASFFISRVDTEIDRRLEETGTAEALALRGKAAVAQAVLAYSLFTTAFSGPRWERLAAQGAVPQRPLWASTSTKNPAYPDTLYVDSLIGPDSVNTLPEATLEAFDDHGTLARTVDTDVAGAANVWDGLSALGIDPDEVAGVLEKEGLASFEASFADLLASLGSKAGR
ncbi:MAG: transaldolase [Actinomycetota bacterium]|jgi:transaldolase